VLQVAAHQVAQALLVVNDKNGAGFCLSGHGSVCPI
jgi:hypothetical protein